MSYLTMHQFCREHNAQRTRRLIATHGFDWDPYDTPPTEPPAPPPIEVVRVIYRNEVAAKPQTASKRRLRGVAV